MRERRYPLHYREPPSVEARRDRELLVVDHCPFCPRPHYYFASEGRARTFAMWASAGPFLPCAVARTYSKRRAQIVGGL